jgi:proteasome accessory factor C
MSRITAADRMRRVLAIVPYIVANPGERVADVATRFELTEGELLADLAVVYMVGLPPYSPDALVDVQIDDEGRVSIMLADFFSRPLKLTAGQGLALLASSDGLLSIPGTDPDGALARALEKLAKVLGTVDRDPVDVHLGSAEAELLSQLRQAATAGCQVEVDYYSYGRDAQTRRRISPWRVFADEGSWYVVGWCDLAEGERIFRVDRINELSMLDGSHYRPPPKGLDYDGVFQARAGQPRITLWLKPEAAWVVDSYPCEQVDLHDDGSITVTLPVGAIPWIERLLVRLGRQVTVVGQDGLPEAPTLAADAARRILRRYEPAPA